MGILYIYCIDIYNNYSTAACPEGKVCAASHDPYQREGEKNYWALVYGREDEE